MSITLDLAVDTADRRLTGRPTGNVKAGGETTAANENVALAIPGSMDGTWVLAFDLDESGSAITGTAVPTLPNGLEYAFTVKGKAGTNSTAVLSLAGDKTAPAASSRKLRTTITPLQGGWARIDSCTGTG